MNNDKKNNDVFPTNNFFGDNTKFEAKGINNEPIKENELGLSNQNNEIKQGLSNLNQTSGYNEANSIDDLLKQNSLNISKIAEEPIINSEDNNNLSNNINESDKTDNNDFFDINNSFTLETANSDNDIYNNQIPEVDNIYNNQTDNLIINKEANNNLANTNQNIISNDEISNNISYDERGFEGYTKKPVINKWILIGLGAFLLIGIVVLIIYLSVRTGSLTGVSITNPEIIYFGEETSIKATALGSGNLKDTQYEFEISDNSLVRLENENILKGKTSNNKLIPYTTGSFTLSTKAILKNSRVQSEKKQIIICKRLSEETVPPEKIIILLNNPKTINVNLGSNSECYSDVKFTIASTNIATIDENRVITGKTEGTSALIITQGETTITTVLQIVAEKNAVKATGISIDKNDITLKTGEADKLIAVISPAQVTNKNVIWSSNNEKIVTVNSKGEIKAVTAGGATITVTTEDGKYKAQTNIIVQSGTTEPVGDDTVAPITNLVSIKSNNSGNKSLAKEGNIITLTVQFNEALSTRPNFEIAGKTVEAICSEGNTPTCVGSVIVNNIMPKGIVNFKISDYKDNSGNQGNIITASTDNSVVTIS